MATFFRADPYVARQASNLIVVTVPGRAAGIEQLPAFGVHGPESLQVLFVP